MKKYKILFIDLDGTLINTITGKTFPVGVWDMKLDFELLDEIEKCGFDEICIITNQGGVEKGFIDLGNLLNKIYYICSCIKEYTSTKCDFKVCFSNNKNDIHRKPNIGMITDYLSDNDGKLEDCLMVGDASGLPGQFSDSDKKTAENAGVDYMDVSEFKSSEIWKNM